MTQPAGLDRPRQNDPTVRAAGIAALAVEIAEWSGGEMTAEQAAADLAMVGLSGNGYEIARELDSYRSWYGIDLELVEILDSASSHIWDAHRTAVKAWVAQAGFTPAFAEGDRVSTPRGSGPIYSIDRDTAQYCVSIDGEDYGLGGGAIIDAEKVEREQVPA